MMIRTTNRVVANAVHWVAANFWSGNPYKCPHCGSTNGWTYDGHCKSRRCGRKLSQRDQAQRINEIVKRKLSSNNPQDIMNLARLSGVPVDILRGKLGRGPMAEHGCGALKIKQKHSGFLGRGKFGDKFKRMDSRRIGFTIAHGKEGKTTEHTKCPGKIDPVRTSLVDGSYVAYLSKQGDRKRIDTHYRSGEDAFKADEIRKWAHG